MVEKDVPRRTIAVDGPAAAGKSTVARRLAERLGYRYWDTGAMYRALTLKALRTGVALDDAGALGDLARGTILSVGTDHRISLDGEDVTCAIRTREVDLAVSRVAGVPEVRRHLVAIQRELAAGGGVVMEGRDVGTVVLPAAQPKFFLTASPRERARRRQRELEERGSRVCLSELERDMNYRDRFDQERAVDPLVPAADAIIVDTSGKSVDQVVDELLDRCALNVSERIR
jgi:cytidylate kinase